MNTEELSGTIDRFLFQNDENGFTILVLRTSSTDTTIVKGTLPSVHEGQQIVLQGAWVMHPKFGKQFDAQSCTVQAPTTLTGLKKYLSSGLIKGIGKVYAEKLVDHFGVSVLEVIDEQPERLREVGGIGKKRLECIISAWKDQKEISNVMVFLQDKGVSTNYSVKIYKKYGQESIALIQENPYRLCEDMWGIGFKTADQIAQQLGFERNSVKRVKAGMQFILTQALGNGHLYLQLPAAKQQTTELLELSTDDQSVIKSALHDLYDNEKIKLITHNNEHFITLSKFYFTEYGVGQKIKALLHQAPVRSFDLQKIYTQLRTAADHDVQLTEEQQQGIMECLQSKMTIITGGPGTGKTTLIKKLLSVLEQEHVRYKLAAPTGRAAKRIVESTGRYAETIHRLLAFDFMTMGFSHNEQNALPLDFLIIDEASMIDIFLAYSILKALPHTAHVVFIGDIDQLPSVGAGNFLNDLIASKVTPCIRLNRIFRQTGQSMIVENAHRINNGEFPTSSIEGAKKDFIFIKETDPAAVPFHLQEIFKHRLPRAGIATDQSLVLVPMNRGGVGTQKLNHDLQNILNPAETHQKVTRAGATLKPNDRVMQLRNNYDKKVFNGDIGLITEIDMVEKTVFVRYPDKLVEYDFTELDELVLAYAITIHKSQGSEFDAVVIPIFMQHFMLLQRNLIYTAITRAKKLCIIIGEPRAIAMAIKNKKSIERTTFLQEFLTTDLSCR